MCVSLITLCVLRVQFRSVKLGDKSLSNMSSWWFFFFVLFLSIYYVAVAASNPRSSLNLLYSGITNSCATYLAQVPKSRGKRLGPHDARYVTRVGPFIKQLYMSAILGFILNSGKAMMNMTASPSDL